MTAYEELEARFRELSHLGHAGAIVHWDEASMMPPGGGEARGASMALLAAIAHQRLTHPELGAFLDQAEGSNEQLGPWQRANVRAMRRSHRRASALPESLVRATKIASTRCVQASRVARGNDDWLAVSALLEEVVRLTIEVATALGESLSLAPYDALLDGYEPDTRSAQVTEVFDDLKSFLPGFLERVLERQKTPVPIRGRFRSEQQHALGEVMMRALGFDFDRGRLDVSHHPFCGGVPDDTRITTRYSEEDFLESLIDLPPRAVPHPMLVPAPVVVHPPALDAEHVRDASVAVAAESTRESHDITSERPLVTRHFPRPALGRAWLPEHPARSPLRRPELLTYTRHTTSSALGAQKFPLAASSRISLSSVKSATARSRRPFSRSSSFRRRAPGSPSSRRTRASTGSTSAR